MTRVPATRTLENALRRVGFVHVAGCDEVGRGCLAGPVVAAAVVLHPDRHISGVCESKTVPSAERERLYDQILCEALAWAVGEVVEVQFDRAGLGVVARHAEVLLDERAGGQQPRSARGGDG